MKGKHCESLAETPFDAKVKGNLPWFLATSQGNKSVEVPNFPSIFES